MKKVTSILLTFIFICTIFTVSGCGNTMEINGVTYDTYGLFNKDEKKNDEIQYELVWENIILGVFFFHTIVAPIYFYGFSMWEPVGVKTNIIGEIPK